jgi:tellurite resistance protein TerB
MRFLDNLKSMSQQLAAKKTQFRSREFAHGSMAMCALIAAADGSIDACEKDKTAELITSNEALSIFEPDDLRAIFESYVSKLQANYDLGKLDAIQAISKLKGKQDQARAMIQIGIVIGGADGIFDPYERAALRNACKVVGLPAADFGL